MYHLVCVCVSWWIVTDIVGDSNFFIYSFYTGPSPFGRKRGVRRTRTERQQIFTVSSLEDFQSDAVQQTGGPADGDYR